MRPRDLEATYAGGPAVRSSAAEDGRAVAARRAPLEIIEKLLTTKLTRHGHDRAERWHASRPARRIADGSTLAATPLSMPARWVTARPRPGCLRKSR